MTVKKVDLMARVAACWGADSPEFITAAVVLDALRKAESAIANTLAGRGYMPGSSVTGWTPEVAVEVEALATARRALARIGGEA